VWHRRSSYQRQKADSFGPHLGALRPSSKSSEDRHTDMGSPSLRPMRKTRNRAASLRSSSYRITPSVKKADSFGPHPPVPCPKTIFPLKSSKNALSYVSRSELGVDVGILLWASAVLDAGGKSSSNGSPLGASEAPRSCRKRERAEPVSSCMANIRDDRRRGLRVHVGGGKHSRSSAAAVGISRSFPIPAGTKNFSN
jgi:hypothetical protein